MTGTGEEILRAASGRAVGLENLNGEGVGALRERLAA